MTNSEDPVKLHLKETIKSTFNPEVIYGLKGEEVWLIAAHQEICIVKNNSGNAFSVPLDKLSGNIVQPSTAAPIDAAVIANHKTKRAPASRKKEEPINQTTLF